MRGAVQGGYSDQRKLVCLVVNSQSKGLVELEIWCIDILSSFLSFLPPLSPYIPLLLVSFIPSNIHHSSLPPSHGSLYPCSDKDLLSQTRTLAMSFVKCASTDTEHQYKLVKDISFWQTPTCRLTVTPNWRYKLTVFFFFFSAQKIQDFDFGGLTANRKWTGWHDASSLLSVYDSQDTGIESSHS